MKTFRMIGLTIMAVLMSTSFSACSSDDDDDDEGSSTLATPKYESVSAKYILDSEYSEYESLELTASGNYIITLKNYYDQWEAQANTNKLSRVTLLKNNLIAATRSYYSNIIYGKYTVTSEGVYNLEGFGTVKVDTDGDETASLTIQETGEEAYVLTAAIENQCPNSQITNDLCRTWNVETMGVKIVYNGKTYFNKTVDVENLPELIKALEKLEGEDEDDEYYEEDDEYYEDSEIAQYLPKEVVFTKAGTYMVRYNNETLAISTWSWANENKGIMRYSWNYDDMEDEYGTGTVNVSFQNGWLYVSETESESEDGETFSQTITWGFSEVK